MRTSDTILGLLRERGSKGLPLERVYRLLYSPDLYLTAYGKIYRNHGALTKGTTDETVDGMSLSKIATIIQALRDGTFQWQPVRRVYIPKKQGKMRPLGLPDWSSKLVQEVIRMLLEAYYEPQFSRIYRAALTRWITSCSCPSCVKASTMSSSSPSSADYSRQDIWKIGNSTKRSVESRRAVL